MLRLCGRSDLGLLRCDGGTLEGHFEEKRGGARAMGGYVLSSLVSQMLCAALCAAKGTQSVTHALSYEIMFKIVLTNLNFRGGEPTSHTIHLACISQALPNRVLWTHFFARRALLPL